MAIVHNFNSHEISQKIKEAINDRLYKESQYHLSPQLSHALDILVCRSNKIVELDNYVFLAVANRNGPGSNDPIRALLIASHQRSDDYVFGEKDYYAAAKIVYKFFTPDEVVIRQRYSEQ